MDVSTPNDEQKAMVDDAAAPRTLMGGTRAMRLAGELYLPREEAETAVGYSNRLHRSTLFNAFAKTVADMTGKVFTKPIVLKDNVPSQIAAYAENIDLTGRHINVFAHDVFADGMVTGVGYILTDMPPPVTRPDGLPATRADEAAAKIRPYLIYVPMERLIGWQSTTMDGAEVLKQVRIFECVSEPDGEFNEKKVEQIRVLEPGRWRIFRRGTSTADTDTWLLFSEGKTSLNKITITPFYANRTNFMTGSPPLAKLAELNVAHWQSQSDQRNILHIARVPILFGAGFSGEDKLVIGAGGMIRCSDVNAKLLYVEHSGAAIAAGDKDLENLENQMQAMGLQLLVSTPGQSATGEMRDDSKENAPLAMMARSLGDALEVSLGFMAEYMGIASTDDDAGGEVQVNEDFGIQAGANTDLQWLTNATTAGDISRETYWDELKRRNVLSDSFDPAVEKDRIASQAPTLDSGPGKGMNLDGNADPTA